MDACIACNPNSHALDPASACACDTGFTAAGGPAWLPICN
jgi:hypothetical protein